MNRMVETEQPHCHRWRSQPKRLINKPKSKSSLSRRCCQLVVKFWRSRHICRAAKYFAIKSLMQSRVKKKSKEKLISWWGMKPYTLGRSGHTTCRLLFSPFALFIGSEITAEHATLWKPWYNSDLTGGVNVALACEVVGQNHEGEKHFSLQSE